MCVFVMSFRSAVGHGEALGVHNGVQMQLHWFTVLELKSLVLELQATNSIGQIHLQLMLASITDEHELFQRWTI